MGRSSSSPHRSALLARRGQPPHGPRGAWSHSYPVILRANSGHRHLFLSLGVGDTAPPERWTRRRRACAAGSYEVTPFDRLVSGDCPSRADESTSEQSERTSAGFDGVRPGSGTHPHADQFSFQRGGRSGGLSESSLPVRWGTYRAGALQKNSSWMLSGSAKGDHGVPGVPGFLDA